MTEARYSVEFADEALITLRSLNANARRVAERIAHTIGLLRTTPFIGRVYDPDYEASIPPFECRRFVVSKTTVELYYTVDEKARLVQIALIRDSRMNPMTRFADSE